jgi:hypothetical protein
MLAGMVAMFVIMGQRLRDQFLGRNQENKPVVINWVDGKMQDFQVVMSGMVVFVGEVLNMTMMSGSGPYLQPRVHIELRSKAEGLRELRS